MKKWFLTLMMILYSTTSFAWVPVMGVHTGTKETAVHTDGQDIYKHSLGILIGKEIRGCKIIDAFYWDHYINIICISEVNTFRKAKVPVVDWTEERGEGWTKGYWDVDVTKEVVEIFKGEK